MRSRGRQNPTGKGQGSVQDTRLGQAQEEGQLQQEQA